MTTSAQFNRIHAVCVYLRGKPCELCSATEQTQYGEGVRGCFALAQETRNIAVYGNPWGDKASELNVRRYQEHFNDE